ncbi:LacI family DNA-binding transcriptional regulator [Levilactobacillus acidifarinae]|nr:LacI family DNA-binding transcriptional regulator [Levilactobacillus acidifarinae]GEO70170.1 LacI family transcriptional regulator [Levilactobacillus acidifarinae]
MAYSMKDIAKEAKVSLTAVSLVLNDKDTRVSESKKAEIKRIAKQMNYRPNSAAVSLSKNVSYNVALIVPDITNPFFARIVREITTFLNTKGYGTLLVDSDNSYKNEKSALQNLISRGVDGVLLVPSNEIFSENQTEVTKLLQNLAKPLVLLNAYTTRKVSYVNFDNVKGAEMATQELINYGHRQIAFIRGENNFVNALERYEGYENVLKKNQITLNQNLVFRGDYSMESGYRLAPDILKNRQITAIVSSNDLMLFGVIKWAKEHQIPIFKRLSMIGFDNTPYTEILEVPLTTIDQDTEKMATDASELLLKMIQTKQKIVKKIIIDPILIRRQSVWKR